jgi:hypothetical protein
VTTTRATIRIPSDLAAAMDLRSRLLGVPTNAEYVRAICDYLGKDTSLITITLPASDLAADLNQNDIRAAQAAPINVAWGTTDRKFESLTLQGRVVSVERRWFATDAAFERHSDRLAELAPLLSTATEGEWGGKKAGVSRRTFGWAGPPGG